MLSGRDKGDVHLERNFWLLQREFGPILSDSPRIRHKGYVSSKCLDQQHPRNLRPNTSSSPYEPFQPSNRGAPFLATTRRSS
jgi:hypothetical protein